MTPSEELIAAAAKLDALIADAAPDWKLTDDNHLALPIIEMPYMISFLKDHPEKRFEISGPNDATTLYIWAMNPLVGKALAESLRQVARDCGLEPDLMVPALLDLARLINGSES